MTKEDFKTKLYNTVSEGIKNHIKAFDFKDHFTPYEFMSLRYVCCQGISELSLKNHQATHDTIRPTRERAINEVRRNKFKIKAYQRCINHLDNWFKGELK